MTTMNAAEVLGAMSGIEEVDDGEANALVADLNLKGVRRHVIRSNEKRRVRRIRLWMDKTAIQKNLTILRRERNRVAVKALSERKETFCW